MIIVKDINKTFGDNHVLRGISSEFRDGVCNLIIGGSGSGKTTLLKCMVGLHEPEIGSVSYDNRDFTRMKFEDRIEIRKEIGMLFQSSALFDSMTVEENIMFPLNMFTEQNRKEKLERVNFCLERVNLEGKNKLLPAELSGGMKKRVGIARSIAMNPKYLFVDEPNSGLDPKTSIVI
ncbi:MAG TPA: ATP-binding cassette domain-containing protein, partial [Daejeonella sp.]|nr:ATP-binding cassette domain-containing protein [Daejeonella sp.]